MHIVYGKISDLSPSLAVSLAKYRHKIFIERLGWSLQVKNGMERDQFDHCDAIYVVAYDANGAICGCARLLPTGKPYLLSEVFPHLLVGESLPKSSDVWELSRFAAATTVPGAETNKAANTRGLLAAAVKCAVAQGAKRLITVSPLGIERLLVRMGVHSHRAAPPTLIDGKPVFACWIELDEQTLAALDTKQAIANDVASLYNITAKDLEIDRLPRPDSLYSSRNYI